ncbi:hypothetical protein CCR85_10880 [Rhodothalassium salexigens]|uniref:hypothetical protein n=1 Tax=Rhodothalassium salexigens TaxID=1086 RepID=UPI0019133347|nr:hypothetical protein [Rhodothalassium salexigens]MBK5911993.1 hypothetical protein [Rhodothalassium salexigens]MBK5922157.1 hypothetical protein [Rhodothalassium salexigens]
MKSLLLSTTALALGVGLAGAAQASVDLAVEIEKDKTVNVTETIEIDKDIDIDADVDSTPDKAAEALAIVNQENFSNEACTNCAEKLDTITNSFLGNSGLVTWNQTSGNMNNQGNVISAAIDVRDITPGGDNGPPPEGGTGFADAQSHAEQVNGGLGMDQGTASGNLIDAVNILFRDALIDGSANNSSGVLFLNQASGNANNQANSLALAVSFSTDGVALAESDLGQFNTNNMVYESDSGMGNTGINKSTVLSGSLNGNQGIVGVNQSAGNTANQANVFSVASVVLGSTGNATP